MADWSDIPPRVVPDGDEVEAAPRDRVAFLGAWEFGGEWTARICTWDEYQKAFLTLPGYHAVTLTKWAPLVLPAGEV